MKEVTEFDDRRNSEITITLNNDYQVIGVTVYFCTPKLIHDFDFSGIAMVNSCGGCSDKGLPRNPLINIPDKQTPCGGKNVK